MELHKPWRWADDASDKMLPFILVNLQLVAWADLYRWINRKENENAFYEFPSKYLSGSFPSFDVFTKRIYQHDILSDVAKRKAEKVLSRYHFSDLFVKHLFRRLLKITWMDDGSALEGNKKHRRRIYGARNAWLALKEAVESTSIKRWFPSG